jgi:2-dehydropantoate 2-reductase
MRILVVGAGGVGGYFGGRLVQAGADVTFLVRPARAARLAAAGLFIASPLGDFHEPRPRLVEAAALGSQTFDLVLLSCKAYDLAEAMAGFAPAVADGTLVLPLLNGLAHLEALDARFGAERVLGGQCVISATLDPQGRILHLNDADILTFGARFASQRGRAEAIAAGFAAARFVTQLSPAIMQEMWEKWVFIASLAGITCLLRASIGDIVAAGGGGLALSLLGECSAIAAGHGYAPRAAALSRMRATLAAPGSKLKASMLRDIEASARIEADHVVGDMLRRRPPEVVAPVLDIVAVHLRAYELARQNGG